MSKKSSRSIFRPFYRIIDSSRQGSRESPSLSDWFLDVLFFFFPFFFILNSKIVFISARLCGIHSSLCGCCVIKWKVEASHEGLSIDAGAALEPDLPLLASTPLRAALAFLGDHSLG